MSSEPITASELADNIVDLLYGEDCPPEDAEAVRYDIEAYGRSCAAEERAWLLREVQRVDSHLSYIVHSAVGNLIRERIAEQQPTVVPARRPRKEEHGKPRH
jgi:hypothetical protein